LFYGSLDQCSGVSTNIYVGNIIILMSSTWIISRRLDIGSSTALWVVSISSMTFLLGDGGDSDVLLALSFYYALL